MTGPGADMESGDQRRGSPPYVGPSLRENLGFMLIEVRSLVLDVEASIAETAAGQRATGVASTKLARREDYIDNLERLIETAIFERGAGSTEGGRAGQRTPLARAVHIVAVNLERIADFATNIVRQLGHLHTPSVLKDYNPEPFFAEILAALDLVDRAIFGEELSLSLEICSAELRIDELYAQTFRGILKSLAHSDDPGDEVTVLFIFRYLERIGDALQNIGEAGLLRITGQRIKVSDYVALGRTLDDSDLDIEAATSEYQSIWGTRSGARIGKVTGQGLDAKGESVHAIFKEGQKAKVEEERRGIERWAELAPEMPPKVLGFHDHGAKASILLEFIRGTTLQQLVIQSDPIALRQALDLLKVTLERYWDASRRAEPAYPRFVRQMEKRLSDVLSVHPEWNSPDRRIGGLAIDTLKTLLQRCRELDDRLACPYSVLLHGDFNTDNIIVDPGQGILRFIDLHRARHGDPVQDLTVGMVSSFRLSTLELATRARIDAVNCELLDFARDYARRHQDHSFEARVALGLARSLLTSTRFALNRTLARAMFHRASYLMRSLAEAASDDPQLSEYRFDQQLLEMIEIRA